MLISILYLINCQIPGYYDENKNWTDISFYNINKNIAVMNYGLVNEDADEAIQFIKTINITENNI